MSKSQISAPIFNYNTPYITYEVIATDEMNQVTDILGRYVWPHTPNNYDVVEKLIGISEIVDKAMIDASQIFYKDAVVSNSDLFWILFFDPNSIIEIFITNKKHGWNKAYSETPYIKYISMMRFNTNIND